MSNTERQRLFRQRHPGYYQRLHAKRRAAINARLEAQRLAAQAKATQRQPLALPAPVTVIEVPPAQQVEAVRVIDVNPTLASSPISLPR